MQEELQMAVVEELLRKESDGTISFGNHELADKRKLEDFPFEGDLYKVKTYQTMTKLERNGLFVYESVPGTSVFYFKETADGAEFTVAGNGDAQITLGLCEDTEYEVFENGKSRGKMKTNLGGKLNISVELENTKEVHIKVMQ